jgi:hypothetical protein
MDWSVSIGNLSKLIEGIVRDQRRHTERQLKSEYVSRQANMNWRTSMGNLPVPRVSPGGDGFFLALRPRVCHSFESLKRDIPPRFKDPVYRHRDVKLLHRIMMVN